MCVWTMDHEATAPHGALHHVSAPEHSDCEPRTQLHDFVSLVGQKSALILYFGLGYTGPCLLESGLRATQMLVPKYCESHHFSEC